MMPHFHIKHAGKEYKIFKRVDERDAPYYVKVQRRGKTYRRCLEVNVQDQAERKAKEIIDLVINDETTTLEAKKLRGAVKVTTPAADATIGDIERAYEAKASVYLAERTVHINILALRLVVREGLGKPTLDDAAVQALKLREVLKGSVVARFETERLRAAGDDEERRQRAMQSINAYVRFARSIFKEKFRKLFVRDCGLALPDLKEFLEEELHRPARTVKEAPAPELVAKTFAAAQQLRATDRDTYVAFLLSACSLRRSEVQRVRWDWVQWEQRCIRVPRKSKSKVIRLIPLPAAVVEELKEYQVWRALEIERQMEVRRARIAAGKPVPATEPSASREFILPASSRWKPTSKSHGQYVLDRVDAFMRQCGWTTQHTVHELRANYLRLLRAAFGLEVAGEVGGHADLRVTRTHYTGALDVSGFEVTLPMVGGGS